MSKQKKIEANIPDKSSSNIGGSWSWPSVPESLPDVILRPIGGVGITSLDRFDSFGFIPALLAVFRSVLLAKLL